MTTKPKTKPVAKKQSKDKRNVSNDPLADLGLEPEVTTTTTAPEAAPAAADTATTDTASHEEVEVGEIEFGFTDFVPTAKRKAEGSKYKFDKLPAPQTGEGGKKRYANFTVKLQEGVDPEKLRRSVQSATTQANRQGKNEGKYFVSRTVTTDGKFTGMVVIRTDERPAD